mgnify:CR=1 FL=1
MKLTGKAKEEFEKWYANNPAHHYHEATPKQLEFGKIDVRCQWGVYQDFADSIGVHFQVEFHYDIENEVNFYVSNVNGNLSRNPTRQEARNASVDKLNELINEN